ncbi:MAG: hypothetical protein O2867_05600, partial [Bacteroidetes bacterium]|nr:hypothetical protein [Bacteroidota bacterium]
MRIALSTLFLFALLLSKAQTGEVRVKGRVVDAIDGKELVTMMAVNKKTGSGTFGDSDGNFILLMQRGDTLLVGAIGYETISYGIPMDFEGSVLEKIFFLDKLVVNLPMVEIISERDLEEIQREIEDLGYDKRDYVLSGVDAFSSPITFLYQSFSKRERSIRLVAEMVNEDRKRALLKDLFKKYVDYDIIQLEDQDFEDFIDFCNVSDYFLKNSSQYDFLVYVTRRFSEYQ